MKAMHLKTKKFCTRQSYIRRSGIVRRRICGKTIVYMSPSVKKRHKYTKACHGKSHWKYTKINSMSVCAKNH